MFLLRNGLSYYRSLRSSYSRRKRAVHPAPRPISRALNILFAVAILALVSTYFQPSNIFALTNSRLQTNPDVIFNRLAALRPLTPTEESLKSKLISKDSKLLYFTYGPSVVANCPFCISAEPTDYLIYALPSILAPHIFNAAVLALVTSLLFTGKEAARWRTPATWLALALASFEVYFTATYDITGNGRSTRTVEIDFFHWRMRLYRGLAIAGLDALLGWIMWLSATGRFFVRSPSMVERLETMTRAAEATNLQLQAAGHVRNAILRDEGLAEVGRGYWGDENGIYEEREVVDAMKVALGKVDLQQLGMAAEQRTNAVLNSVHPELLPRAAAA